MKFVFVVSGPVGVGKSAFCDQFRSRFGAIRLSTREILTHRGVQDDRRALQEAGEKLDAETNGKWVAETAIEFAQRVPSDGMLLIDSARIEQQIEYLRRSFGQKVIHVHLTATLDTLRYRYQNRERRLREFDTYDELRNNTTEAKIEALGAIADTRIATDLCEPASVLALAVAGRALYPTQPTRLVDVIIGAQYGSEGKGHICSYLASDYDVLVRVGGPNAGHWACIPKSIKYVQLPSGTAANPNAKILIGAGATIRIPQILGEIANLGLTPSRLSIDPNAMIIEDSDIELENQTLDWPAPGSADTELGVLMEPEVCHGEAEVYTRVQA